MGTKQIEDGVLIVSLDAETVERLLALARLCGDDPASMAASLLHDLLEDDEFYNSHPLRH